MPIIVALVGMVAIGLTAFNAQLAIVAGQLHLAPAPQVAAARLAPGTKSLLRQTAEHLSRMQGGESIGGFPGFEPPDDDERYRSKIENETYTAEDVNGWVREISNFLRQIADKNPRLMLEQILQRQGLTSTQIGEFLDVLREVEYVARSQVGYGVKAETLEALQSSMRILGVSTWPY